MRGHPEQQRQHEPDRSLDEQQSKIDKRARSTTMSELIPDRASAVGQRAHPDYPDWLNIAQFEFQVLRTRDELESITESWQQLADARLSRIHFLSRCSFYLQYRN